ncbi:MAG: alcohol dehydrogenase catalytic domain-containing protein [Ruthenibacterium lactatiformans]
MKGAFFLGNREFEVRDMEKRPLAADEVRIRVMACGVCGTDVHIYHGEAGSAEVTPPVVLGHEYAGIVEEVGADVKGLAPGDHVAVDPNIYCGACTPCRDGKSSSVNICRRLASPGTAGLHSTAQRRRHSASNWHRSCPLRQEPWPSRWRAACTVSMPRVYGPAVRYV